MRAKSVLSFVGVFAALVACGADAHRSGFQPAEPGAPGDNGPVLGEGENKPKPSVSVSLEGTVKAPNGSLPMASTLVYVTSKEPPQVPKGAYCDECVTLEPGTFALSDAHGKVKISTQVPAGDAWVVVQKGQFRRVRKVTIEKAGEIDVADDALTLPGKADTANGDTVPKMVILMGELSQFDHIEDSLKKLGITDVDIKTDRSLLDDQQELMKYQVVFIPCGEHSDPHVKSDTSKANLQKFVAAGGKLYVTDWSYEFVRQPFPGFVRWENDDYEIGSAAYASSTWDAPAAAADKGLGEWLSATGDSSFEVKKNWTTITSLHTLPGVDAKGQPMDIEPKVWVTAEKGGKTYPTISFTNRCGRVLFSTYHTESEAGGVLLAQEKALLYVLLEVGVCLGGPNGVH